MTTCEQLAPLLVSRPLGLLERDSQTLVGAHLGRCEACQSFAREVERALSAASLPAVAPEPPGEDPPGWASLRARIAAEGCQGPGRKTGQAAPRSLAGLVWVGLALGSVVAVAALWPAPRGPAPQEPPPVVAPTVAPPGPAPAPPEPGPAPPEAQAGPEVYGAVVSVQAGTAPLQVLLSVGADDGVERGRRFAIYRDGRLVGEVVVERVTDSSSSCRQSSSEEGFTIQPGDQARSVS